MSDYNPGPGGYDKYGNTKFEPGDPGGRGPYILLGILVAIGLIGGLLYFNGTPKGDRTNEAQAPRSMTAPGPTPMAPAPATPTPAPAPSAPSSTDNGAPQKQ
jgi:hypothetical protein